MEHIRNNQTVFANILILSASEKCLLTCLVQVLFFKEHLATNKTRSTVPYESDKGIKSEYFLKPTFIWNMLAASKPWDKNDFK